MRLNDVKFSYGRNKVLDKVSFQLQRGDIVGLLGLNGVGKTTLIRLASGMVFPDHGTIEFDGSVRALIEQPFFFNDLTGRVNIQYFLDRELTSEDLDNAPFSCTGFVDLPVRTYSLGMRQKLALWMMLLFKAEYLFLDEPFLSLDPESVNELIDLLIKRKSECGILISSHNIREIQRIASRVLIIADKTIAKEIAITDDSEGVYRIRIHGDVTDTNIAFLKKYGSFLGKELRFVGTEEKVADVIRELVASGIGVCEVSLNECYLESQFYECTSRKG